MTSVNRTRIALVAVATIAGSLAPARGAPPSFNASVTALKGVCGGSCYEPSIATDRASRVFVTSGRGDQIGVSTDGGATFTTIPGPPLRIGVFSARSLGDALVQTAPSGRLYFSNLFAHGVQVAWSDDAGATWGSNVFVSLARGEAVVVPDRQWLGFGAGGTVYLSYSQVPSGIYVLRSDDGGATFPTFARAAATEERQTIGQAGPVVVGPSGVVYLPYFVQTVTGRGPAKVAIAVSSDGGRSFGTIDAYVSSPGEASFTGFPILSAGADGHLWAAWSSVRSGPLVTGSTDGGATWAEVINWAAPDSNGWTCPWIEGRSDHVDVLMYRPHAGVSDVVFARASLPGAATGQGIEHVTLATDLHQLSTRNTCNTDYGSFATGPDGCVAVVWSDDKGAHVATGRCGV